ncbi:MAG: hypothetical protein WBF77_10965 [Sulfurimonadaceae bacterium]
MNYTPLLLISLFTSTLLSAGTVSSKPIDPSLVVYNGNLGLVHENRQMELNRGKQALVYNDVASSVITDSVNVTLPEGVTLYSQQYRFDQINAQKLALAHLGKSVKFYIKTGSELMYKSGTLLSASSQAVIKTAKTEIYTVPTSALIFSNIPKELITKPSLVWNVNAPKKSSTTLTLDYLINNISWKSNYVLNLDKKHADLSGWITIDNRSGKAFNNTKLTVLAGDINRAVVPVNRRYMAKAATAEMDGAAVQELSHEGYHLYQIPFNVNLTNNEKTQIKFLDIKKITIERKYEVHLGNPFYFQGEQKHPVTQYLEIKSLEKVLPMGTIRSYSKEGETTLLLGESSINHTPKHEEVKVTLGKNFDLLAKSKMVSNSSDRYFNDSKVSYELTNRSKESKTVELLVPFTKRENGQSSISTKQKYSWKNGNMLSFNVAVKADSKKSFEVHFRAKK